MERDKYLTEAMGGCWHETRFTGDSIHIPLEEKCVKCGVVTAREGDFNRLDQDNNDFSTPDGFFKLWDWAINQKWWVWFWDEKFNTKEFDYQVVINHINPDNFANAIYDFLKEREE